MFHLRQIDHHLIHIFIFFVFAIIVRQQKLFKFCPHQVQKGRHVKWDFKDKLLTIQVNLVVNNVFSN